MTDYIKKPHARIFIGQTGSGKTHLVLELTGKEYNKHFEYIVIICPTLRENNKTYHTKEWIKNDDNVWLVDPKDKLYQWNKNLSELLRSLKVLFIIYDIITNKDLDKRRQPLLELSLFGRYRGHYRVLTEDELVVAREFLKSKKYGLLYIRNEFPGGFKLLNNT